MAELQAVGSVKKLNNQNYNTWSTCMESLQGQDLWEIVAGSETTPPDNDQALRKWKVKAGKAMFAIKTSIEEEMLEHIRRADTPKAAWDTFATLFSKKNNVRLQLLENELMSIAQRNMTITQYFTKRRTAQGNTTIFTNQEGDSKEEWDAEASFFMIEPIEEEEMAETSIVEEDKEMTLAVANPEQVNYREDWIVDSGCSNDMTGHCYTSRNVIFDEASSWWSEDKATLPVLKEIEERMPESMEEQSEKDQSKVIEEIQIIKKEGEPESREITQSPWQMGVHHKTPKEDQLRLEEVIEGEESLEPQLRRSTRQ
uniref:Uncharacterized protein n=1 Tax=Fagus sylvatica TaxID=28930 RepID=A0A2N9J033_FAGSY